MLTWVKRWLKLILKCKYHMKQTVLIVYVCELLSVMWIETEIFLLKKIKKK